MDLFFKTLRRSSEPQGRLVGLEVIQTFGRTKELHLVNSFTVWQFLSKIIFGKTYCIYAIVKNGECVHYSHVLGKGIRFPFMKRNDIQIGPCWTRPDHRNQGIFTSVIKKIVADFSTCDAWASCDEDNLASRKGLEKAGLNLVAKGERTRPLGFHYLGRFVITFWITENEAALPLRLLRKNRVSTQ
jgi:hypothetical protein